MRLPEPGASSRRRAARGLLVPLIVTLFGVTRAAATPVSLLPLIGDAPAGAAACPVRIEVSDPNPIASNKTVNARIVEDSTATPGGLSISLSSDNPDLVLSSAHVFIPVGQSAAGFQLWFRVRVPVPTTVVLTARVGNTATSYPLQIRDMGQPLPQLGRGVGDLPVYNPANGHWYQAVRVPGGITWPDARDAAAAASFANLWGHLATLTSPDEIQFALDQVVHSNGKEAFWLGGYQDANARGYAQGPYFGWRWVTAESLSDDLYWNSPGPRSLPGPGAIQLNEAAGNGWDDELPSSTCGGYVIEYDLPAGQPGVGVVSRISVMPNTIVGGQSATGLVTVSTPASPLGALVHLRSDNPDEVEVPDTVTVPPGQSSVTFLVATQPASTDQAVEITAAGEAEEDTDSTGLRIRGLGLPLPGIAPQSPPAYDPDTGHWYQTVRLARPLTGAQAEAAVEALSYAGGRGHLATITSTAEGEFVTRYLAVHGPTSGALEGIWLGGFQDPRFPGLWRWVSGEPWSYARWKGRTPYSAPSGGRWLDRPDAGGWDTLPETATLIFGLVEYEAEPSNLKTVLAGPGEAILTWTDNSTAATGFEVQRRGPGSDWALIGTAPANSARVTDGSLIAGHYDYRVRALEPGGPSAWSNEASVDAGPGASASLDLASHDFGAVLSGTAGMPLAVTLASNGLAPLQIRGVSLSGANPGDFSVSGLAAGTTLAPGTSATLIVTFAPRPETPGRRAAVLTIDDNAPGSPHTVALTGTAAPPLPTYVIVDLGVLDDPGMGSSSSAEAINNLGQIVGVSGQFSARAFLDDGGKRRDLGLGVARSINARGDVAGVYGTQPCIFTGGGRVLPTLGGPTGEAWAINSEGEVAGTSEVADPLRPFPGSGPHHAFLFDGIDVLDLGTLGGTDSAAFAINSAGRVVGTALTVAQQPHAVLAQGAPGGGAMTDLNDRLLPSAGWVLEEADAINDAGQIAGVGLLHGHGHAFLLDGSNVIDLSPLGGDVLSEGSAAGRVFGMNAAGQVVGTRSYPYSMPSAFLYSGGVALDLNNLLPAGSGWTLQEAHGINDAGQIVGVGVHNGEQRAFLLTFPGDPHLATPAAPTGLTAQASAPGEIDLMWIDNSTSEQAFAIWRQVGADPWQRVGIAGPHTTTFADRGVAPNTPYSYRVRAIAGSRASAWSGEATATTPPLSPAAPAALRTTAVLFGEVDLAWYPSVEGETAVAIFRQVGSGPWQRIAEVPPDATHYIDRSVQPGTNYTYRVRSHDNVQVSAWSNAVPVTTVPQQPAPPNGLMAEAGPPAVIYLGWAHGTGDETAIAVFRQRSGGPWERIAEVDPTAAFYADRDVQPGVRYRYRVRSHDNTQVSAWSNEAPAGIPLPAPAPPASLSATVASGTQIDLSWTVGLGSETAVAIFRQAGSGPWQRIAEVRPDATSYADRSVQAGVSYSYQVRTHDNRQVSAWSNEVEAVTPAGP